MEACFGILGPTALLINDELVENWGPPRERAVLATLLAHPNVLIPIDLLVDWVWSLDKAEPQNPSSTFHTYSTRIRRSLAQVPIAADLRSVNGGYRLEVDRDAIDYHRFRRLVGEARGYARENNPHQTAALTARALDLWRGPPLTDVTSERANAWRTTVLHNEWLPANRMLLDAWLQIDHLDEALSLLGDLQSTHPDDVSLAALRMSALHRLGRGSEATAYYFSARRRFLTDGDEHAAEHLRRHHEKLRGPSEVTHRAPLRVEPVEPPRQLPNGTAEFVGRTALLDELDTVARVAENGDSVCGVVILDGTAGVGKTALAVHWGHRARRLFPDGSLFASLDGYSDREPVPPHTVVDDFLIALDQSPDKTMSPRTRERLLARRLAGRRTLVVLDNARNTDQVSGLVALLSTSCFVVVTSRQRLSRLRNATGARSIHVNPMSAAESGDLLAQHFGDRLSHELADRVSSLCGGLPLVISVLADHAARGPTASLTAFIDRLDRRQLITEVGENGDGAANAVAFFTTSYQALAEPERRLFRLLALCPGPDFSAAAATACDGRTSAATTKSLGALVGANLLELPNTFDRYRFHDLLGEFAKYCVEVDENPASRHDAERRVLSFYLGCALRASEVLYPGHDQAPTLPTEPNVELLDFPERDQAKSWFDRERRNLVSAVTMAHHQGHDGHGWRLADPVASYFDRRGYIADSQLVRETALLCTREVGDRDAEASFLLGLGMSQMTAADFVAAHRSLDTARLLLESQGHERGQAAALHQLGRLAALQDDPATATRLFRECLNIAQRIGDMEVQSWTCCRLAHVLISLEQYEQAETLLFESIWLAKRIDDWSAHSSALAGVGAVCLARGDLETASAHCTQARTMAESVPDIEVIAQVCLTQAEIAAARREAAKATDCALRAISLSKATRNVVEEARALDILGAVARSEGELADSASAWRQAVTLYRHAGNTRLADAVQLRLNDVELSVSAMPDGRGEASDSGIARPRPQHSEWRPVTR